MYQLVQSLFHSSSFPLFGLFFAGWLRLVRDQDLPDEVIADLQVERLNCPAETLVTNPGNYAAAIRHMLRSGNYATIVVKKNGLLDEPAHDRARLTFRGENCTIIYTDVVGFSSAWRDDNDRLRIRHQLATTAYAALKPIWSDCFWGYRGDGWRSASA